MYSHFDADHWMKVKAARAQLGLSAPRSCELPEHPLVRCRVVDARTNKVWQVVSVQQQWWRGRFLVAMVERAGSHMQLVVGNISCDEPGIQQQLRLYQEHFHVV